MSQGEKSYLKLGGQVLILRTTAAKTWVGNCPLCPPAIYASVIIYLLNSQLSTSFFMLIMQSKVKKHQIKPKGKFSCRYVALPFFLCQQVGFVSLLQRNNIKMATHLQLDE